MNMLAKFDTLMRANGGAAAVEFAFLAPILLLLIAGITDGAVNVLRKNSMHSGVSSSAQIRHERRTGPHDGQIGRPVGVADAHEKATLSASKLCYCDGAVSDCSTLCTADSSVPKAYVTISASDVVDGWYGTTTVTAQQEVRVR